MGRQKSMMENSTGTLVPFNAMNKCIAIYARQSVEKEGSISIETQIDWCKSRLNPDEQVMPLKVYVDEGKSGGNIDRAGFQDMMKDVRKGRVAKIVIYKLDRISRSMNDFINMWQEFKKYGVVLSSAQESFDTNSPLGEMLLKMLILFAEFERESIIKRVRDACDSRAELGLYAGGKVPYGYTLADCTIQGIATKKYTVVPEEAEVVKLMFDLCSQGYNLTRIHKHLKSEGICARDGEAFTVARIADILRNCVYVKADVAVYDYFKERNINIINDVEMYDGSHSIYEYGKSRHDRKLGDLSDMKLIIAPHEGFIDSSVWIRCQEILGKNRQVSPDTSSKRSWIKGLVKCAKCGSAMVTTIYKDTVYFNCYNRRTKGKCKGPNCVVYAESLENYIYKCICDKLKGFKKCDGKYSEKNTAEANDIRIKLRKIEQEEQNIANTLTNSSLNKSLIDILSSKADSLSKEREALRQKLETLTSEDIHYSDLPSLINRWYKAKYSERNMVARTLIDSIYVYENGDIEVAWKI